MPDLRLFLARAEKDHRTAKSSALFPTKAGLASFSALTQTLETGSIAAPTC